jgi:CO/xanthine dehydrogenase Mo-binding subunit
MALDKAPDHKDDKEPHVGEYRPRDFKVVGTRPVRPDGIDKVTGRAQYGADLSAPGMLVGLMLRAPHAHARITKLDISAALAMKGVKANISSPATGCSMTAMPSQRWPPSTPRPPKPH